VLDIQVLQNVQGTHALMEKLLYGVGLAEWLVTKK